MAGQERPKKRKKQKRKLTPAERAAKKRRRDEYTTVFINGKQKRVRREPTLDGLSVDEYVRRNADPIWLHMHEMWELIEPDDEDEGKGKDEGKGEGEDEDEGEDEAPHDYSRRELRVLTQLADEALEAGMQTGDTDGHDRPDDIPYDLWEPMDLDGDVLDAVGETVVDNSICPGRDSPLDAPRG